MAIGTAPRLRVEMIGGFTAHMNGVAITVDMWPSRRFAELVQLLALARGHRPPRDRVMESLRTVAFTACSGTVDSLAGSVEVLDRGIGRPTL